MFLWDENILTTRASNVIVKVPVTAFFPAAFSSPLKHAQNNSFVDQMNLSIIMFERSPNIFLVPSANPYSCGFSVTVSMGHNL